MRDGFRLENPGNVDVLYKSHSQIKHALQVVEGLKKTCASSIFEMFSKHSVVHSVGLKFGDLGARPIDVSQSRKC